MGMVVSASIFLTTTTLGENWINFNMIVGKRQGITTSYNGISTSYLKSSPLAIAATLAGTGAAFAYIDLFFFLFQTSFNLNFVKKTFCFSFVLLKYFSRSLTVSNPFYCPCRFIGHFQEIFP
jgi:hypothetical protein